MNDYDETPELTLFRGRIGPRHYFVGLLGAGVFLAFALSLSLINSVAAHEDGFLNFMIVAFLAAYLVLTINLTVRRLNDIGASDYWVILPLVFVLTGTFFFSPDLNGVLTLLNLAFTAFLCIKKGNVDFDNAYGPPPPPNSFGGFIRVTKFGFLGVFLSVLGTIFVVGIAISMAYN
jgi:uncharacterized membrane protein YhaH (DUF805 family)